METRVKPWRPDWIWVYGSKCEGCSKPFYRESARHSHCISCSPRASKPENKTYTCGRCGKDTLTASSAKKQLPCPACRKILDRQAVALVVRSRRERNRARSKFGKWLIEDAEHTRKKHPELPLRLTRHWTPMRYVSKEEISERELYGAAAVYAAGRDQMTMRIYEPGFERIEYIPERRYFVQACAGGIPSHHRNGVLEYYHRWRAERKKAGAARWEDMKWERRVAKEKADIAEKTRRRAVAKPIPFKSECFFQALAMAGAGK